MNRSTVFERNPTLQQPPGRPGWARSFAPVLDDLRGTVRRRTPESIAAMSGAQWEPDAQELRLDLVGEPCFLPWPHLVARDGTTGDHLPADLQGLLLYYLVHADGSAPEGTWISFRELPDGWLYHQAFQGYTGGVLVRELAGSPQSLERAALKLAGSRLAMGDRAWSIPCLPRILLAVVCWDADEEFPAQAQLLFDQGAGHYLPTDGLAILGSLLVRRILKLAQSDRR